MNNNTEVNTGGAPIQMVGSAIGSGNTISGNTFDIAGSLNISQQPKQNEILTALRQLQDELAKAKNLPTDDADDLQTNLDAAIKAVDRPEPNKDRALDKLTTMEKILNGLKDNLASAMALGSLVGQAIMAVNSWR